MDLGKYTYYILVGLLVFAVLPFLLLSFFSVPAADDFYFSARAMQMGLSDYLAHFYERFTGRVFPVLLFYFNPLAYSASQLYFIIPLLTISGLIAAFYCILPAFHDFKGKVESRVLVSLLVATIFLHRMPSTAEGLYWTSGALFYGIPMILFMIWLRLFWNIDKQYKPYHYLFLASLTFILPLCNEVMLMPAAAMLLLHWMDREKRKSFLKPLLLVTALFALGMFVQLLAPGNYERMGDFNNDESIGKASLLAFVNIGKLVAFQLQNPALILAILVMVGLPETVSFRSLPRVLNGWRGLALISSGIIFTLWAMYFPSLYISGYVPWRIHNSSSLILLLGLVIILIQLRTLIKIKSIAPWALRALLFASLLLMFSDFSWRGRSSSVEYRGNIPLAWHDLLMNAPEYKAANDARIQAAMDHKGQDLRFAGMNKVPRSLHFTGLKPMAEHDLNKWYSDYFALNSVVVDSNSAE